ncbi:thiamine diphosphokinase [Neobacillus notoginsengisoli]|uniref:Thiamine diphosphokinase n=1 Tax=Neobacillus notoginsengisoli TaxID=1578198 RepID=A0A417YQT7_9BACI|nr:thiamine diphosphokinase [Neobacillus notoginsengisoli]RHW36454.1 thiamine diphosphokinase [Neobacillus notoginsengisoli]
MNINIMGGGPPALIPSLESYRSPEDKWIGVDRGTAVLLERGINPYAAFGDFDSVTEEELAFIKTSIHNLRKVKPEKDETDMELALEWAVQQNPRMIRLFGATGGRIDHFLANLQLMQRYNEKQYAPELKMIDIRNTVYIKSAGTYQVKKDENKYISFLPGTSDVSGLTLKGFKYPLENRHIPKGSTLCISNELVGDYGTFSFSEGILIIIRSDD